MTFSIYFCIVAPQYSYNDYVTQLPVLCICICVYIYVYIYTCIYIITVTLFDVMIGHNWWIVMEGVTAANNNDENTRAYFLAFMISAVVI